MGVLSAVVGLSVVLGGGATVPPEAQRLLENVLSAFTTQANSFQPNEAMVRVRTEEALAAHAKNCSPEELDALANEALRMGKAMPDRAERVSFGCVLGEYLPGDTGLNVMSQLVLTEDKTSTEVEFFLNTVMKRQCPGQLGAETVMALHREYSSWESGHYDAGIKCLAIQALGATGPTAVDYLIGLKAEHMDVPEALGSIGTPKALGYLMQAYQETEFALTRVHCIAGLSGRDLLWRDPSVIRFVRRELMSLLADPEGLIRRKAATIAGLSGDPFFLPVLEKLAQTDPHVEPITRSGYDPKTGVSTETVTDTYTVREDSAEGVKNLRMRIKDPRISKRVSELKNSVDSLKQHADTMDKLLAAEEYDADTKANFKRERNEALQQLPALEAELAELQAKQEAHIQRVVAEVRKNAQVP